MDVMVTVSNMTKIEDLDSFVSNGVNVLRFNFSHIQFEYFEKLYNYVKQKYPHVKLLQDLQGTKIRISDRFIKTIKIPKGKEVCFCSEEYFNKHIYKVPYALIPIKWEGDFNILFNCKQCNISGGVIHFTKRLSEEAFLGINVTEINLKADKGINFLNLDRKNTLLTKKDIEDLNILKNYPMDYICLSFVENKKLIDDLKVKLIDMGINNVKIIAKIETLNGFLNFGDILEEVYGIMLGRGDLSKEVGNLELYQIQKKIIERLEYSNKYLIIATYILENMTRNTKPTVSELVALRYFFEHKVNCLMLANEVTIGKNPVETVKLLNNIIDIEKKEQRDF